MKGRQHLTLFLILPWSTVVCLHVCISVVNHGSGPRMRNPSFRAQGQALQFLKVREEEWGPLPNAPNWSGNVVGREAGSFSQSLSG